MEHHSAHAGGSAGPVELRLPAARESVSRLRSTAREFARRHGASSEVEHAVALAVSEVASNAVLHAYPGEPGWVSLSARREAAALVVEVADGGRGLVERDGSPGMGLGLLTVGRLASALHVGTGEHGQGTVVRLHFALDAAEPAPEAVLDVPRGRLEAAIRRLVPAVGDVLVVDAARDGVLRRLTAHVDDDPGLTAWLAASPVPAKPGTSTWAVLRGEPWKLVVHDPTRPRTAGGTGETLGLAWWLSCRISGAGDRFLGILGVGGRGERPPPGEDAIACARAAAAALAGAEAGRGARGALPYSGG